MVPEDDSTEDEAPPSSRDWDADAYHRISLPQTAWGQRVLAKLDLKGDETVLDAGCGSGKLTGVLCSRLPRGKVIALDSSDDMLRVAKKTLAAFGEQVTFVHADLASITMTNACDVVFSTATFHWVLDHDRLFANLFRALVPGGRLHAQCGGGKNLAQAHARAEAIMQRPELAPYLGSFHDPTYFSNVEDAQRRLALAGFTDVHVDLEDAPTVFTDRATYRTFLEKVILGASLERLPDQALRDLLLDAMCDASDKDEPPYSLDYVRLNLRATKPI